MAGTLGRARTALRAGDAALAATILEREFERRPKHIETRLLLATAWERTHVDPQRRLDFLEETLDLAPTRGWGYVLGARAILDENQPDARSRAVVLLRHAVQLEPNNRRAHALLSRLLQKDEPEEAFRHMLHSQELAATEKREWHRRALNWGRALAPLIGVVLITGVLLVLVSTQRNSDQSIASEGLVVVESQALASTGAQLGELPAAQDRREVAVPGEPVDQQSESTGQSGIPDEHSPSLSTSLTPGLSMPPAVTSSPVASPPIPATPVPALATTPRAATTATPQVVAALQKKPSQVTHERGNVASATVGSAVVQDLLSPLNGAFSRPPAAVGSNGVDAGPGQVAEPAIAAFIEQWRREWLAGSTNYSACYAPDFVWSGGNRSDWIAHKQRIFQSDPPTAIEISQLNLERSEGWWHVSFAQAYRSRSVADFGRKTLQLVQQDGQFRIVRETWQSLPPW